MPAAAMSLKDVPAGALPCISKTDLIIFKINSCGLRAQMIKRAMDAGDAEALLEGLTVHASLNLTAAQRAIVEPCLDDVVAYGTHDKAWWSERLGLPTSQ